MTLSGIHRIANEYYIILLLVWQWLEVVSISNVIVHYIHLYLSLYIINGRKQGKTEKSIHVPCTARDYDLINHAYVTTTNYK